MYRWSLCLSICKIKKENGEADSSGCWTMEKNRHKHETFGSFQFLQLLSHSLKTCRPGRWKLNCLYLCVCTNSCLPLCGPGMRWPHVSQFREIRWMDCWMDVIFAQTSQIFKLHNHHFSLPNETETLWFISVTF